MTRLRYATSPEPITLADALTYAAPILGPDPVGWLSSATDHRMVRLVDSIAHTPEGPVDLTGVFSARLFTPVAELRWLHTGTGHGDAVLLTETNPGNGWPVTTFAVDHTIDGRYALWGRRVQHHPATGGWVRALEGRIGWLDVPAPARAPVATPDNQPWPTEHLAIDYREYVTFDPRHGNAFVAEERLLAVVTAAPTSERDTR